MSLEYINELVNNKYNEVYNIETINNNELSIAQKLEQFIYDNLNKYNKTKFIYFIEHYFNIEIEYIEDNITNIDTNELKICRNDEEFKKAVNDLYKTCIICDVGDCHKSAYEVAHILDFSKCETINEKYDVNNGILLCANMHKYFDSKNELLKFNIISNIIDDSNIVICKIVFCDSLLTSNYYKKYNGKQIKFNKQNILYLNKKYNK
jgi:predicted restriction endonuclease